MKDLQAKYDALTRDHEGLKSKFDLVTKERATLVERVTELANEKKVLEEEVAELKKSGGASSAPYAIPSDTPTDDAYWANLLREKAARRKYTYGHGENSCSQRFHQIPLFHESAGIADRSFSI